MAASEETFSTSNPSTLGNTTLPKETLCYRWVIHDIETFINVSLDRGRLAGRLYANDYCIALKSHPFSIALPSKDIDKSKSSWFLAIERANNCRGDRSNHIFLSLWSEYSGDEVLISGCTFSFLNPSTSEVKYSVTGNTVCCKQNFNSGRC